MSKWALTSAMIVAEFGVFGATYHLGLRALLEAAEAAYTPGFLQFVDRVERERVLRRGGAHPRRGGPHRRHPASSAWMHVDVRSAKKHFKP